MSKAIPARGPWKAIYRKDENGLNDGSVLSDVESGRAVCVCKAPKYSSKEQWEADSNLLESVPDLIKEVERVQELVIQAAEVGFNPTEGDWAEKLFESQHDRRKLLKKLWRI